MSKTMLAGQRPIVGHGLSPDQCARLAAWVLAAMPPLFAIATYQPVVTGLTIRTFSLPVVFAEGLVAWLAIRSGFDAVAAVKRLEVHTLIAGMVWLVAVLAASLFAWRDPVASWIWAGITLMHGLFALALWDRFSQNWFPYRERFLDALCFGLAAYVIVAVLLSLTLWQSPNYPWTFFGIGVSNVRQLCFYGLPLIAIAAGKLSADEAAQSISRQVTFLTIGMFAVFWSGGRANVLAAGGALALAIFLSKGAGRIRLAKFSGGATLVAAPLSIFLAPNPVFGASNLVRFLPASGSESLNHYSSSRWEIWQLTLSEIADQPLLGHAQGSFPQLLQERLGIFYNHPHNFVIQFPYEIGLPGAVALLAIVIGALKGGPALYRSEPVLATMIATGLTALTINASLEGAFFHPLPVLCAILLVSIVPASARLRKRDLGQSQ